MKVSIFIMACVVSATTLHAQSWNLTGNTGTTPGVNYLGTSDNQRLVIATNATERMTVTNSGRVGIGTATPSTQFQVHALIDDVNMALSGVSPSIKFHSGITTPANIPPNFSVPYAKVGLVTIAGNFVATTVPGDLVLQSMDSNKSIIFSTRFDLATANGTEQMRLNRGNLGIGITNPTFRLHVNSGSSLGWYSASGWGHSSDRRLKNDIQPIGHAMDLVRKLNGVYFKWIGDQSAGRQLGFIAQDVRKVLPEVVVGKEGDIEKGETLGMVYQNIVPVLVEALKEKDQQISDLQRRLEKLENVLNQRIVNPVNSELTLDQNFPNPFTASTRINYAIDQSGHVLIELFNQEGAKIKTLENADRNKGSYTIQINGSDLPAGTYIYSLSLNGQQISRRAVKL